MSEFRHDFRSDTLTKPTEAMRAAIAAAEVGDDVYGEDPTVLALEAEGARVFAKEAALFCTSGTQSNLIALIVHCERGDEYIAGNWAHLYRFEAGGGAVLGSIQPQPLPQKMDGTFELDDLAAAIKPDDPHYARTRLLALENTFGGQILPAGFVEAAAALARENGLALHLDGARVFNAAVGSGRTVAEVTAPFDTVSACLSKGLGAPAGSLLLGPAPLIKKARRVRKILGGGLRQAGILAAAGLYALEHNVARLADDHRNAARLAEGLRRHTNAKIEPPHTNIVFLEDTPEALADIQQRLAAHGIGSGLSYGSRLRMVTHLDVDEEAVDAAIAAVADRA